jgi:hypothetical protein
MQLSLRIAVLFTTLSALPVESVHAQSCSVPASGFHGPATDGQVFDSLSWDDGSGPALYVAGRFQTVADVPAWGIARWNGTVWSAVGPLLTDSQGTPAVFSALCVHGGALHVATSASIPGQPSSGLARWDGSAWSTLPIGPSHDGIQAMASYQGSLFVGGSTFVPGVGIRALLARFDGSTWNQPAGGPFDNIVEELRVWDAGSGPRLYAGGSFRTLGSSTGPAANGVASFDGTNWATLGTGLTLAPTSPGTARALEVFDSGSGAELVVGGSFQFAGGVTAPALARWNGSTWAPVVTLPGISNVYTLRAHDDGAGVALYAGARTVNGTGQAVTDIVRVSGASWTALGANFDQVPLTLGASGLDLYVGGSFWVASAKSSRGLARYSGGAFVPVSSGPGFNAEVISMCAFERLGTTEIYAAVERSTGTSVDGYPSVRRWNGTSWSAPGTLSGDPAVLSVATYDDGIGARVFAIGGFTTIAGQPAGGLAAWDGASWSAPNAQPTLNARALRVLDLGSGPRLLVTNVNMAPYGLPVGAYVARWTGSTWQAVGPAIPGQIVDVAVLEEPGQLVLHAITAGPPGSALWRLDPVTSTWSPVGSFDEAPEAIASFDDGSGPALYVCGRFSTAGGIAANHVARWDGSTWSAVGGGLGVPGSNVVDLEVHRDGARVRLFATGNFLHEGRRGLAAWDGSAWTAEVELRALLGLADARVGRVLLSVDDGRDSGPDLWVGGAIAQIGDEVVANVGKLDGCGPLGTAFCIGDGSSGACPCNNQSAPAAGAGCRNSLGSGARLAARGAASVSADTYRLIGASMTNGAVCYFAGASSIANGGSTVFGDGLRCASGVLRRLGITTNVGGASSQPNGSNPTPLSVRDPVSPGEQRVYQAVYRDASPFCTSSTFNVTNSWQVIWSN